MRTQTLEEILEETGIFAEREARIEAQVKAQTEARVKRDFAQKLIRKGLAMEEIAEVTGLDLSDVESLYNPSHT